MNNSNEMADRTVEIEVPVEALCKPAGAFSFESLDLHPQARFIWLRVYAG